MGYIFLSLSLLCGVTKGYCSKKTSILMNDISGAALVNFIRMLFCIVIGFILIIVNGQIALLIPDIQTLWISALSGISTSIFVICWMLSVQKNAYMMVDVSLLLGTLIPLIGCRLLYNEYITPRHWLGSALLFIAVILMCSYSSSLRGGLSLKSILILILCGVANGLSEFTQKLFVRELPDSPIAVFNFYTYVFSCAALLIFRVILAHNKVLSNKNHIKSASYIIYVIIMSVCLFGHSYFHTAAASILDSAQLYPVSHGCALILSSIMSSICFKETPSMKSIIGLSLAFVALLLMNV